MKFFPSFLHEAYTGQTQHLGEGAGVGVVTWKIFGQGCATGTLNTPPIHIISRLTKHTYSYNLHVKRYSIDIIEEY